MKHPRTLIAAGLAGALAVAGTLATSGTALAWEPRKPVEFIIMAGTGGGADQMARMWQGLIEKKDLSPRPFIPINKPGGSGAEALRYLQDKEGDDHVIMVTLNSFYTTPIIQEELGVDVTKFTPIGRMALDTFLLWVHADQADITDLDSYVSAVKAAGKEWKVGGTGSGQEDSILTAMMENEFGYEVTYIPFPGGGTVAKNLIGKHIDSTVNNPSEQNEFYRAGKSKPLVQFTGERAGAYPDIPPRRSWVTTSSTTCSVPSTDRPACRPRRGSGTWTCSGHSSSPRSGRRSAPTTASIATSSSRAMIWPPSTSRSSSGIGT